MVFFLGNNTLIFSWKVPSHTMKTLPISRGERGDTANVECAEGVVSVYRRCAYCAHCKGVFLGDRRVPAPQDAIVADLKRGIGSDEMLLSAALQFNTLIRDGNAIACSDDANHGYQPRYRY
ncbi:MAG: hypothetical protein NT074_06435 [Methanomicrobiales archaeon]|jgi:hypothetical protein|nr:hypothetical protein [Methanomicrobiales archaeon]